ncbi:MAG TPA: hydantoinase B/oxoprolinase family protein [Bryobacteraceae bacterium]|nr:hydantoinase B/oxoprolinase family protein [Bryobacteraceae bacterium]
MKHDPVELELARQLLVSVAEEMGVVLRKTAYSPNIKERRDYSCAVYDRLGNTIAMGDHMPVHLGAMPLSVRHVIDAIALKPGDVAILNDPFRGGTHLPDITAVAGVYLAGETRPTFYVANRAHHSDVGGMSSGSMPLAKEIYQEGLRIPPILLVRGGEVDRALMELIFANVRTPSERSGDLLAQWMALQCGERRLLELVRRHGRARLLRNIAALQNYAERMMRAAIQRIPAGSYEFEDFLDDDGVLDEPIRIRVVITVAGGGAHVDFTGSEAQSAGPVNANYAISVAAAAYVFRCLIARDVPFNAGLMRPIRITSPGGTVVNALPPAAMAGGNVETSQRITDVLLGALAKALPEQIPAASSGTMNNVTFGGWDKLRGKAFAYYETIAGGMGAGPAWGGQSAVHTHMTNSWNTPIEALEHAYPVRVRAYRIRKGSGGTGRRAGGDGIVRELEFLAPAELTLLSDRRDLSPYGLEGGRPGKTGRNILRRGSHVIRLPGKVRTNVRASDVLRIETPGGGGHGK